MASGVKLDFDHVALAASDATPVLELLVGQLGATDLYGATDRGFRWVLLHAGDAGGGMLIELLDAWSVEENPFLERFLERRGEGAHHLTFKTSDIRASIETFEAVGLEVIDRQLENPVWQEAFVRPRDAYGTIVQLVQTTIVRPPLTDMLSVARGPEARRLDQFAGGSGSQASTRWWVSPAHRGDPVALSCVVFAAEDPEAAAGFYEELLGGARVPCRSPDRIELAWPSGAHVGFAPVRGDGTGIVAFEFEDAAIESFTIGRTTIAIGPGRS